MVDLESTQMRIGPEFTLILGFFGLFSWYFEFGGGGKESLEKKIISGIDRARFVDLESTHVRIGPGNTRIVPEDILRLIINESENLASSSTSKNKSNEGMKMTVRTRTTKF